jgi:hypothetical protein
MFWSEHKKLAVRRSGPVIQAQVIQAHFFLGLNVAKIGRERRSEPPFRPKNYYFSANGSLLILDVICVT